MGRRVVTTLLALAISAGALAWLLSDAVVTALVDGLDRGSIWSLGLAFVLVPVIQWLRAWRFALLDSGRLTPPSPAMFAIAIRLIFFNLLLPFKLGELSFPVMMRRAFGTGYTRGTGILLLARLIDLGVVAAILLGAAALTIDPARTGFRPAWLGAAALAAFLAPLLLIELLGPFRRIATRLPRLLPAFDHLTSAVMMVRPLPARAFGHGLALAMWLGHALVAWLAAIALAPETGLAAAALAGAASNLAFALPIPAIAGLGPPQAAWALAMSVAGTPWRTAVATGLLCHGVLTIGVLLLGAATWLVPAWRSDRAVAR